MNVAETYTELLRQGYCMPMEEVREDGISWWAPFLGFVTALGLLVASLLGIFGLSAIGAGDIVGVSEIVRIFVEMVRVTAIGLAVASFSAMCKFLLVEVRGE